MGKKSGLGKGLDVLFMENDTDDGTLTSLRLTEIVPNQQQPRRDFNQEQLRELADSIQEHGVIQPLVVRPLDQGYQIVAGERRWRAARMAGLDEVPVVIRELDDAQTLEIAIIENLQREDLNPIELAFGYKALMEEYHLTQEQVAERVGKSRPVVANTLRLLSLPDTVIRYVRDGRITLGHAKALLSLEDPDLMQQVSERAARGEMLVRDIEKLARDIKQKQREVVQSPSEPVSLFGEAYHREMESALSAELGRKVRIASKGKKATITLEFYNDEELTDIIARLTRSY